MFPGQQQGTVVVSDGIEDEEGTADFITLVLNYFTGTFDADIASTPFFRAHETCLPKTTLNALIRKAFRACINQP